jgi:protocatechuate 3,4-dioxygenase beta subunit
MNAPLIEPARRRFLKLLLAAPVVWAAGARLRWLDDIVHAASPAAVPPASTARRVSPTPECDDDPTPSETEGPFYTPETPKRTSLLEPGMTGTRIELSGRVLGRDCRPVAGAVVDFWHADDDGEYDNEGFRLRGHQLTDAEGRWRLQTIVPGLYPGRTRHYHVKVRPPGGRTLTTQLYFPGEARNGRDGLFRPDLLLAVSDGSRVKLGRFDFVLDVG